MRDPLFRVEVEERSVGLLTQSRMPLWRHAERVKIVADSSQPTVDSKRPGLVLTVGDTGLFSGQRSQSSRRAGRYRARDGRTPEPEKQRAADWLPLSES
jgi:hypothetical protein